MTKAQILLLKKHTETLLEQDADAKVPLRGQTVLAMIEIILRAGGFAVLMLIACLAVACGGAVDAPPAETTVKPSIAWLVCTSVSGPSDLCPSGSSVTRCEGPMQNPDPDMCALAAPDAQSEVSVWCCR